MAKAYVIYNLIAGHETREEDIKKISVPFDEEHEFKNIKDIENYSTFINGINDDDIIILCGGDGTLNRFVNDTKDIDIKNDILYYPCGTGNDFAADLGHKKGDAPFNITKYLKNLPVVTVNGKKYRFINGVGYGIDGYCCEVGDRLKAESNKPVNYTSIAIKGLLFKYKPTNAKITVDGIVYYYKKVWLAPTMNGRFYGGGMIPTPNQDRCAEDKTLSTMVYYGSGKLKSLIVFPSIFKGEHVKHTEMIKVHTGKNITVEFDRPVALQIDGETILGVTSYTAEAEAKVKA